MNSKTPPFLPNILFLALIAGAFLSNLQAGIAMGDDKTTDDPFARMDRNGDGYLNADEFGEEKQRLFDRLLRTSDANDDGKISAKEFSAGMAPKPTPALTDRATDRPGPMRGPAGAGEFFTRLDRNGDGKLQKDELPSQFAERLQRADLNKDGVIEKTEFERARKFAMSNGNANSGVGMRAVGMAGNTIVRTLDTDGDGELSATEIAAASGSLKRLDRNSDGSISRAEMYGQQTRPEVRPTGPAMILDQLKRADRNGDGKLSREEAPPRLAEAFQRVDRNGDGFVDQTELEAVIRRFKQQRD